MCGGAGTTTVSHLGKRGASLGHAEEGQAEVGPGHWPYDMSGPLWWVEAIFLCYDFFFLSHPISQHSIKRQISTVLFGIFGEKEKNDACFSKIDKDKNRVPHKATRGAGWDRYQLSPGRALSYVLGQTHLFMSSQQQRQGWEIRVCS